MIADRLELWRLSNFDLERLPSAQDVYLFRAQARENPRDQRLLALAEVTDLTPVRDEDGPHHRAARARAHGPPGVRRHARLPVAPAGARAAAVEPAAALRVADDELRPGRGERRHPPLRAAHARARAGARAAARPHARRPGRRRAQPRAALLQPGRARHGGGDRRPADAAAAPARRGRAADRRGAPPRHRPSRRAGQAARARARRAGATRSRPGSSSSTTWTTRDGWCRSTARRPPTRRASSSGSCATGRSATRRACCASRCWATRRARSARSPSRSAGA